jgi:hypothetical protein
MSKTKQLIEDIDYLETIGMTTEQLRLLHHWGGDAERETRVTFASARSYFSKEQDLRENNAAFADRVRMVADMRKRGLPAFIECALRSVPR